MNPSFSKNLRYRPWSHASVAAKPHEEIGRWTEMGNNSANKFVRGNRIHWPILFKKK
jgi:NOL1/NOP2/fmu family ribosome biogenesis protein